MRTEKLFSNLPGFKILYILTLLVFMFLLLRSPVAIAVPGFARQTGMACTVCHTVYPELTSFGRNFKLTGYTLTTVKTIDEVVGKRNRLKLLTSSPLSGMAQLSVTDIKKKIPGTQNYNAEFPQQFSFFYSGLIASRIGAFVQITYDQQGGAFGIDNADIRYAQQTTLASKDITYGFTLNNNPTVQDIWNSTPAWGFPYASSAVAPTPSMSTMLEGSLSQQVMGIGTYCLFNNLIYAGFSVYRSAQQGASDPPGSGAALITKGIAPYWRLAIEHQWSDNYLEFGTYGMSANLYPTGVSGQTDRYTDMALDLQYEHLMTNSTITLHSSWIHENQMLYSSYQSGDVQNEKYNLQSFKVDGNIFFKKGYGFTLGYFLTEGNKDDLAFLPSPVDGSRAGKPDSDGMIAQLSFLPWDNTKFSVQYILNNKFNGSGKNYDGFNRNASDNNSLYLLIWLNF